MTAAELNSAVRAEIVELLGCTGRQHLVDAAKADDLVNVVGMLFSEITHLDSKLTGLPALRERLAELEGQVAETHGPMQETIRKLNAKIVAQNVLIDLAGDSGALPDAELQDWKLRSRVADLLHLLEFSSFTTSQGIDDVQATKVMAEVKAMLSAPQDEAEGARQNPALYVSPGQLAGLIEGTLPGCQDLDPSSGVYLPVRREPAGNFTQPLFTAKQARPELEGLAKLALRLVEWRHLMSYNDSYFGEPEGGLKRLAGEMKHVLPPHPTPSEVTP